MAGAVLSTLDNVLDSFLAPLQNKIDNEGLLHTCGAPYELTFAKDNGRLLRPVPHLDAYEFMLTARCRQRQMCSHPQTTHNYARQQIAGYALASLNAQSLVQMMKHTLDQLTHELIALLNTHPAPQPLSTAPGTIFQYTPINIGRFPMLQPQPGAGAFLSALQDTFDPKAVEKALLYEWLTETLRTPKTMSELLATGKCEEKTLKAAIKDLGFTIKKNARRTVVSLPDDHPLKEAA